MFRLMELCCRTKLQAIPGVCVQHNICMNDMLQQEGVRLLGYAYDSRYFDFTREVNNEFRKWFDIKDD